MPTPRAARARVSPARAAAVAGVLGALLLLASCSIPDALALRDEPRLPPTAAGADARAEPSTGGVRFGPTRAGDLDGRVVVVDPGHAGVYKKSVSGRLVDTAAGRRPCVQAGGTAKDGTTEHALNWDLGQRLATTLRGRGATVILTRPDDAGVGPCNNERADIANRARANLLVSIHVDGNETRGLRGFHVITSPAMLGGDRVRDRSTAFAEAVVRRLKTGPIPPANYIGTRERPIKVRDDLAVLNGLRTTPGVLVETGNIIDPRDWAQLGKPAGRQAIARALADAAGDVLR